MNHQTFLLSFYFTFIIPLFCIDAKCKPPTTAPIVTTRYGKVAGSVMKFKQNDDYVYLYQGIRYGKYMNHCPILFDSETYVLL